MADHTYRWPEGMWERANAMLESGMPFKVVAAELKIPEQSLHSKAKWERMSPEQKARKNARSRAARAVEREKKKVRRPYIVELSPPRLQFERASVRPSPELIAERDRRLAIQPRDLTASFFGDPLPGYSALERRA